MQINVKDMGFVRELGKGGSEAPAEVWWYGTPSSQVAVKRYAGTWESDMKLELGLASMTDCPTLLRLLGGVQLDNGDSGIVSELHLGSLAQSLRARGSAIPLTKKAAMV
jgi:hypothetical protein